jgi:hypothetical protein
MNQKLLQRVEEAMREADDYYISQEQIWAGVVAVLEEAAKVAERSPDSHWGPTIADAIRKLKGDS